MQMKVLTDAGNIHSRENERARYLRYLAKRKYFSKNSFLISNFSENQSPAKRVGRKYTKFKRC